MWPWNKWAGREDWSCGKLQAWDPLGKILKDINHPAISNFAGLLTSKVEKSDIWAVFEVGGTSLSKTLFSVKGSSWKMKECTIFSTKCCTLSWRTNHLSLSGTIKNFWRWVFAGGTNYVYSDLKPDYIPADEALQKTLDLPQLSGHGVIAIATPLLKLSSPTLGIISARSLTSA